MSEHEARAHAGAQNSSGIRCRRVRGTRRLVLAALFLSAWCGLRLWAAAPVERPNEVVVGSGRDLRPMMFLDADGRASGRDADLWRLWSEKTGVEVGFRLMEWDQVIPALLAGDVDVVSGASYTPERAERLVFSEPYDETGTYIYNAEALMGLNSLGDLEGFPVGVMEGSSTAERIRADAPQLVLAPYTNYEQMVAAALDGKIQVLVAAEPLISHCFAKAGGAGQFRRSPEPVYTMDLRFALRKEDTALLRLVEQGMAAISPQERRQLERRWTSVDWLPGLPWNRVFWVTGILIALVAFLFLWNTQLRRAVAARTEALRASEERLQLAITGAELGTWDYDVTSGCVAFNERAAQIAGLCLDELELDMEGFYALVHPQDADAVKEAFQQHAAGSSPGLEVEHRLRHSSGEWIWVLNKGKIIERDAESQPVRACGTLLDITRRRTLEAERLNLERQMLHAQKLESLGVLAGGIAHDFNNILMAILGYAGLAAEDLPPHSPARESLEEVERAARQAAALAREMLAYSGRGDFMLEPIRLNELVGDMVRMLEVSISKKAELKCTLDEPLPPFMADATQIRQVVMNLVTNASESLGQSSGVIAVSTGVASCDRAYLDSRNLAASSPADERLPEGDYVYVEVADTGSGMDEDTLAKVFDPFFTTRSAGRGLGMAAVLGIVRGHGGAIVVDTAPFEGTTVRVLFPIGEGVAEELLADAGAGRPDGWRGSGTILFADDEDTVQALAGQMLTRLGFEVVTAADGRKAVEIYAAEPDRFACVILDVAMPELAGDEAVEALRKIRPGVKVILSSGYTERDAVRGKDGVTFLQKPYQLGDLREALRQVLE